jgi:hypothetical protein
MPPEKQKLHFSKALDHSGRWTNNLAPLRQKTDDFSEGSDWLDVSSRASRTPWFAPILVHQTGRTERLQNGHGVQDGTTQ